MIVQFKKWKRIAVQESSDTLGFERRFFPPIIVNLSAAIIRQAPRSKLGEWEGPIMFGEGWIGHPIQNIVLSCDVQYVIEYFSNTWSLQVTILLLM